MFCLLLFLYASIVISRVVSYYYYYFVVVCRGAKKLRASHSCCDMAIEDSLNQTMGQELSIFCWLTYAEVVLGLLICNIF